ncbi:PEP-CTERM sorting domain-containing protein [Primorskyibacter sp. S187A]|uniref:PEP-CTERM sorting domain-containing protein n=1 Tax=Primorskyibacter sp. S187A TaxID=3415130 RepID=UPI003C7B88FF
MTSRNLLVALAASTMLATPLAAATIGSFDDSRTVGNWYLTGAKYDSLSATIEGSGSTIAEATSVITSEYLDGVDAFYTGSIDSDARTDGHSTDAELLALQSWVSAGGLLVIGGENAKFTDNANSWMNAFGLTLTAGKHSEGTFSNSSHALMDGVTAGAELGALSGGAFADGDFDILASTDGGAAIVAKSYGLGTVVALADGNFWDDGPSRGEKRYSENTAQFAANLFGAEQPLRSAITLPSPVPLPASLPLALAGLGGLLALRRKRAAA